MNIPQRQICAAPGKRKRLIFHDFPLKLRGTIKCNLRYTFNPNDSNYIGKVIFKCNLCKSKSIKSGRKCMVCASLYHESCAERKQFCCAANLDALLVHEELQELKRNLNEIYHKLHMPTVVKTLMPANCEWITPDDVPKIVTNPKVTEDAKPTKPPEPDDIMLKTLESKILEFEKCLGSTKSHETDKIELDKSKLDSLNIYTKKSQQATAKSFIKAQVEQTQNIPKIYKRKLVTNLNSATTTKKSIGKRVKLISISPPKGYKPSTEIDSNDQMNDTQMETPIQHPELDFTAMLNNMTRTQQLYATRLMTTIVTHGLAENLTKYTSISSLADSMVADCSSEGVDDPLADGPSSMVDVKSEHDQLISEDYIGDTVVAIKEEMDFD